MGTCGSCRYWQKERDDFRQVVEFRDDRSFEERYQADREGDLAYGKCLGVPMGPIECEPLPLAVTMDASAYQADLFTQAEFGCVLYEPPEDHE